MRSLASTVARLASDTVTVHRKAGTTYDANGRATGGADASTFSALVSVQPATAQDLLRLPEGERTRETIAIFSSAALQTTNPAAGTLADVVEITGRGTYEVQSVANWSSTAGFYKCLAARRET